MKTECKEFEQQIPAFLDDGLTNAQLKHFLAHLDACEDCKEELTIQLLTQIGTQRLEDGKAFHLGRSVEACIAGAKSRLSHRQRLERLATFMQSAVFIALILLAVLMILLL